METILFNLLVHLHLDQLFLQQKYYESTVFVF